MWLLIKTSKPTSGNPFRQPSRQSGWRSSFCLFFNYSSNCSSNFCSQDLCPNIDTIVTRIFSETKNDFPSGRPNEQQKSRFLNRKYICRWWNSFAILCYWWFSTTHVIFKDGELKLDFKKNVHQYWTWSDLVISKCHPVSRMAQQFETPRLENVPNSNIPDELYLFQH